MSLNETEFLSAVKDGESWMMRSGVCVCTHVLVGGLIGADEVGVEARQAHNGPHREETHQHLQHSHSVKETRPPSLQQLARRHGD